MREYTKDEKTGDQKIRDLRNLLLKKELVRKTKKQNEKRQTVRLIGLLQRPPPRLWREPKEVLVIFPLIYFPDFGFDPL